MTRPLQQLILEVLQSRPPRRDVQSYLAMFGSRARGAGRALRKPPVPRPFRVIPSSAVHADQPSPLGAVNDSEHGGSLKQDATIVSDRVSEEQTVSSLPESHTALVKLQGPFTDRQLISIAKGLAYLKQLGLLCVVVLDHDGWNSLSTFQRDGTLATSDTNEIAPWLQRPSPLPHDPSKTVGIEEAGQRNNMIHELWRVSNLFAKAGVEPRPLGHAVMRIAPADTLPPALYDQAGGCRAQDTRAPLVADTALQSVFRALDAGQTPVIIPLALYGDQQESLGALRSLCVDADDVMVALTREMAYAGAELASLEDPDAILPATDLTPLRLMVINREGGIPSHARGGNPHLSINLQSEYESIRSSFVWGETHPTALSNLDMIRDCLAYMPATSSGVMVTHRSPRSLIANLITNKAAHSPSLPPRLLAHWQLIRHTPTILRTGLPVRVLTRWDDVDQDKLQSLLERSFGRTLDRDAYFARLATNLDFVIITGDYLGLAIVTKEYAPEDIPGDVAPIAYLDKFAVLPELQGSGAVDFLWGALRDEVHGLGLLDALNNNGGRNGYGTGRDLVWKSRAHNPVNRWYFERSNGFIRLPPTFAVPRGGEVPSAPAWTLFWCDSEQRLAELAGHSVLTSAAPWDEIRASSVPVDSGRAPALQGEKRDGGHRTLTSGSHAAGSERPPLSSARLPSDTLLPVIAREEYGRLERWAACLETLPSAWA